MIIDRETLSHPLLTFGLAAMPLAALAFSEAWQVTDAPNYARIFHEDGPAEVAQAAFYAVSATLAVAIGWRLKRLSYRRLGLLYGFLAAIVALFALEEISWGQRLLGFGTPDFFARNNVQGEVNLHNLDSIGFDGRFGFIVNTVIALTVLYISLAWLLAPSRLFPSPPTSHFVVPSWYLGGYFLPPILWTAGLGGPEWMSGRLPHEQEFAELLYAAGCFLFMILGWHRLRLVAPARSSD